MALMNFPAIVAAHGQWDFNDGRSVEYVDLIDATGGGLFRVTMAEGETRPPVFAQGDAHLEVTSSGGDRPKTKLKLRAFQIKAASAESPPAAA